MIAIERDKCINCSICACVCPHGVIGMDGEAASLRYPDKCITCGACQLNCPSDAVSVIRKTGCVITIIREDILNMKRSMSRDRTANARPRHEDCNV